MASNPMQRKSRNSFLLGVIITLLIAGVIIALLFLQLKQKTEQLNAELNAKVNVYVLTKNVKSGQVLTQDMFTIKKIHKDTIPSNATATSSVISTWYLQTKDGTMVNTDSKGLYLDKPDSIIEVTEENGEKYKYTGGEKTTISSTYRKIRYSPFSISVHTFSTILSRYNSASTLAYAGPCGTPTLLPPCISFISSSL